MSAMSAIAAQPVEDKRGNWDSQEQELWPVELPPQMHDGSVDEELAELKTLEERILHKYTPAKLDLDSHPLPPSSNSTATAFVQEEANSYPTVKPCATCFGIGKVAIMLFPPHGFLYASVCGSMYPCARLCDTAPFRRFTSMSALATVPYV